MRLLLILAAASIFALGLVMVYNTSSAEILDRALDKNTTIAFFRQIAYAMVGFSLAFTVYRMGYKNLLKFATPLFIVSLILLLLVFVPGIGKVKNGAHRWMGVGDLTLQPSEFVKFFLPMVYINYVMEKKGEMLTFFGFAKIMAILGSAIFLVMIEPDNGTAAVISASLVPLIFLSKVRFRYWFLPLMVLLAVAGVVAMSHPYVRGRIQVYLHPELDLKGKGHQPHQAKIAAGSGGLFGRGAGESLQKFTYLPEAQNDYIAAIYAEEFGFVGILVLLVLYMLVAFAGFSIAFKTSDMAAMYLASAITFLIALQAFLNLGVASGLLPSKGVNLPFFSQGGTSLVANLIGLSILLSVAKNEKEEVTT